nr:DNA cytosine methyltransferase [Staphylococcus haemolyticus]
MKNRKEQKDKLTYLNTFRGVVMAKKLDELKKWARENVALISILPPNTNLSVTTRLIDVLEDEVDEKYYLSEEKTKKLTLNEDLSGRLNHYDYRDVDSIHSTEKVSPTLNTMQGGDRQPKIAVKEATKTGYTIAKTGDSVNTSFPNSKTRRGRVGKQIAQTLQAGDVNQGVVTNDIRIRKLVPIETWRLQGFSDEQFYKAENSGVSNSQLYKQAGNAVTVNVVDAIVGELE